MFSVDHGATNRPTRDTPATVGSACSPSKAKQTAFPVASGGAMPPVESCAKQDYAVLIMIGWVWKTESQWRTDSLRGNLKKYSKHCFCFFFCGRSAIATKGSVYTFSFYWQVRNAYVSMSTKSDLGFPVELRETDKCISYGSS